MKKIICFFPLVMVYCLPFAQPLKKGNIAISADKMNILYFGIDNPISFSAPAGSNMPQIKITNGQISGEGFNRIVRPDSDRDITITVNTGGLVQTFPFHVKRIPDPEFKIGFGNSRISLIEFKAQNYCRAELSKDFPLDCKFTILEATISFSGNGFPEIKSSKINGNSLENIKTLMNQCVSGSVVTIENIKVQGPDGVRTINDRTLTLF
ncbi:MAG: hypothetical protein FGM46_07470 [Ferruginibacter sp.]|nr:hypothetical protein [Ferruginibacter sp.]